MPSGRTYMGVRVRPEAREAVEATARARGWTLSQVFDHAIAQTYGIQLEGPPRRIDGRSRWARKGDG